MFKNSNTVKEVVSSKVENQESKDVIEVIVRDVALYNEIMASGEQFTITFPTSIVKLIAPEPKKIFNIQICRKCGATNVGMCTKCNDWSDADDEPSTPEELKIVAAATLAKGSILTEKEIVKAFSDNKEKPKQAEEVIACWEQTRAAQATVDAKAQLSKRATKKLFEGFESTQNSKALIDNPMSLDFAELVFSSAVKLAKEADAVIPVTPKQFDEYQAALKKRDVIEKEKAKQAADFTARGLILRAKHNDKKHCPNGGGFTCPLPASECKYPHRACAWKGNCNNTYCRGSHPDDWDPATASGKMPKDSRYPVLCPQFTSCEKKSCALTHSWNMK